jgi:hypothetical protein
MTIHEREHMKELAHMLERMRGLCSVMKTETDATQFASLFAEFSCLLDEAEAHLGSLEKSSG